MAASARGTSNAKLSKLEAPVPGASHVRRAWLAEQNTPNWGPGGRAPQEAAEAEVERAARDAAAAALARVQQLKSPTEAPSSTTWLGKVGLGSDTPLAVAAPPAAPWQRGSNTPSRSDQPAAAPAVASWLSKLGLGDSDPPSGGPAVVAPSAAPRSAPNADAKQAWLSKQEASATDASDAMRARLTEKDAPGGRA
eukprot:3483921-Prymnesium_polylepis.1